MSGHDHFPAGRSAAPGYTALVNSSSRAASWALAVVTLYGLCGCIGPESSGGSATNEGGADATAEAGPDVSPGGADSGGDTAPIVESGGGADVDATPSCPAGQTYCETACVDTMMAATDCGGCGLDCGGGSCSAGKCSPTAITSNLATAPYGIAVAGGQAFWVRSTAVENCPVTGCASAPHVINSDMTVTNAGLTGGTTIVTDGNFVGWLAGDPSTMSTGYPGPVFYSCHASGCNGNPKLASRGTCP